ncbi:MAG: CARDB domain-containing protein [Thermoplasmatota archaeon]
MSGAKRVPAIIAVLLIGLTAVSGNNAFYDKASLFPDPVLDFDSGPDVVTWRVGDFWNYSTEFSITYLVFTIPFTGWLNISVMQVILDFTYSNSPVYILNVSGNISGILDNDLLGIHERIYVDIHGYMWTRIQDLSNYRMVMNATVSGTQTSVNGEYPYGYEYFPAMEQFDFPILPGDTWNVNVSARIPFGGSGDILTLDQKYACPGEQMVSVPAGSFLCNVINIDDEPSLFFNRTVGNSVKMEYSLDIDTFSATAPFELETYSHAREETGIRIWIEDRQPVWAGGKFALRGEITSSNKVVTILFPNGEVADVVPLIGTERTFRRVLTAPMEEDNTPTRNDHGSFGILAVVGTLEELDVCSITTKAADLELTPLSMNITHTGNGTIDDTFTVKIKVFDPMNYGVSDFSLILRDLTNGTELLNLSSLSIEAHGEKKFEIDISKPAFGNHTLELVVDPMDEVLEYNESNNVLLTNYSVLERPDIRWETNPPPGNVSVKEMEVIMFLALAYRGEEEVPPGMWRVDIDGRVYEDSSIITLMPPYTGWLSSRDEPYSIEYQLDREYYFGDENGTVRWNLTVIDVDQPPVIDGTDPDSGNVTIAEGEQMEFRISCSDIDEEAPIIRWYLDTIPVRTNNKTYAFKADFLGVRSSEGSPFNLSVQVMDPDDPSLNSFANWTIFVIDVDRKPLVTVNPAPGNYTLQESGSLNFSVDVEDPDGGNHTSSWFIDDGLPINGTSLVLDPQAQGLAPGVHIIRLLVVSGAFNGTYIWNITIMEKEEEIRFLAPAGVDIVSPTRSVFEWNETIVFEAVHIDARPIDIMWHLGTGWPVSILQGDRVEINTSMMQPGSYTILLNASTTGPPVGWIELELTIIIEHEHDIPPVDDDDGGRNEGNEFPWWAIIVSIFILLCALLVMGILLYNRNKESVWTEE